MKPSVDHIPLLAAVCYLAVWAGVALAVLALCVAGTRYLWTAAVCA